MACNVGVSLVTTSQVCLLNSDVLSLSVNWLTPLSTYLAENPDELVAPVLLTDDGSVQHAGMHVDVDLSSSLPRCVHSLKGLDPSQLNELSANSSPYSVDALSGAALIFEKSRFLSIGGFQPVFGRGDFEDLELSLRWKRLYKSKLTIIPDSRLLHLERQSIDSQETPLSQWRLMLNAWFAKRCCPELQESV